MQLSVHLLSSLTLFNFPDLTKLHLMTVFPVIISENLWLHKQDGCLFRNALIPFQNNLPHHVDSESGIQTLSELNIHNAVYHI